MMSLKDLICLTIVLAITSSAAIATPIEVGTGGNNAGLYIEWSDGYIAELLISFDGTVTGEGLFDTVDTGLGDNFVVTKVYYEGFGAAIDGIYYNDGFIEHFNPGWVGGEDWWHYWTKDAGETNWSFSSVGCSDRTVGNGDMDGWIYGRAGVPIPEPVTVALLGLGALLVRRKQGFRGT